MKLKAREKLPQRKDGGIADDYRVDAALLRELEHSCCKPRLPGAQVGVDCKMRLGPLFMDLPDDFRQFLLGEVACAAACIQPPHAEIDCVGARLQCGVKRI